MTDTDVINVSEDSVLTRCGQLIRGRLVIDCRGPGAQKIQFAGCGYQKFHGFELELEDDWPSKSPIIMESVVDQKDGFRFLYTLPFTPRRVLVEDTRFSDTPDCDRQECFDLVKEYLAKSRSRPVPRLFVRSRASCRCLSRRNYHLRVLHHFLEVTQEDGSMRRPAIPSPWRLRLPRQLRQDPWGLRGIASVNWRTSIACDHDIRDS